MSASEPYADEFYENRDEMTRRSAEEVVPIVLDLVAPRSVVDVGCGVGTWLSVFRARGVEDILGVDGDWVKRSLLAVPEDRFRAVDLEKPFALERTFDLAVTLEVAEHLPAEAARGFVASLVKLAPAVLFSAAVPFQGGRHHVNEQWPEYWAALFAEHGFAPADGVRRRVWTSPNVLDYYAQNILLFASEAALRERPALAAERDRTAGAPLSLVHPKIFARKMERYHKRHERSLRRRFRSFLGSLGLKRRRSGPDR